jgi:hypothetical protein
MREFSSSSCVRRRGSMRVIAASFLTCCLLGIAAGKLAAQSTFGEILGTVHDSSGAVVAAVQVTLVNSGP